MPDDHETAGQRPPVDIGNQQFDPDQSEVVGAAEEQAFPPEAEPLDAEEHIYQPAPDERQLTLRAVVTGAIIGCVVAAMNISIGLQIGWTFGGSIIAAILGFAFFKTILRPKQAFSVLETNTAQTTGSAAGAMASAAGLVSSIPALLLLKKEGVIDIELGYLELTFWALSIGFLGVFFAVPLRRQMVVVEKLRFPSGTATAQTIVSIFAEGAEALRKARALLLFAIVAGAFVLLKYTWFDGYPGPYLQKPPMEWLGAAGAFLVAWGFMIYISPVMLGAGLLIGPRVGASLLAGAIVGWLVLGYGVVYQSGWVSGDMKPDGQWSHAAIFSYLEGVRGWILWPGVAIMIADALMSLALSWRTILNTFRRGGKADALGMEPEHLRVPNHWWMIGLACGTVLVTTVAWFVFSIPPWMTIIAVMLSWVLAAIAVRSTGETDINPTGGMGKVTQLAFGGLAPGEMVTNLMAAGVSSAGASQAGDMMHDLKAGRMLGAAPRKQVIAQCVGIVFGILVVVPIFLLFDQVHDIGGDDSDYPAPAALAWKAMAQLLSQGLDALPQHSHWAVLGGAIFGAVIPILRRKVKPIAPYLPSGLAFGIAFIIHAYFAITMFIGSMILVIWRSKWPASHKALVFAVASGLLAGEGVMNVVTALLDLAKQALG
jgi:putative OPT family oligopeptide transporter